MDPRVDAFLEMLTVERGAAREGEQLVHGVLAACGDLGDELLGQDVQWRARGLQGIEHAPTNGGEQGDGLDECVTGHREESTLGCSAHAVVGSTNSLQERGDRAG